MLPCRLTAYALLALTLLALPHASAQQPQKAGSSKTGSIFVSNNFDRTVSVISAATNRVTATIHLSHDLDIRDAANNMYLSPDDTKLNIVTGGNANGVGGIGLTVISTASDTIVGTITDAPLAPFFPTAFSPDGRIGYYSEGLMIGFVSTENNSIVGVANLGFGFASSFAPSPDGTKLYVTDTRNEFKDTGVNVVWAYPTALCLIAHPGDAHPGGFAAAPTSSAGLKIPVGYKEVPLRMPGPITTGINIPQTIDVIPVGHNPDGITVSADNRTVYVSNGGNGTVSVISTASDTVTTTIPVGVWPQGIAVSPDGTAVYVVNHGDSTNDFKGTVSVISTATNKVIHTIPVGRGPVGVAVSGKASDPQFFTVLTDGFSSETPETRRN